MLLKSLIEQVNYNSVHEELLRLFPNDTQAIKDHKYKFIYLTLQHLPVQISNIDIDIDTECSTNHYKYQTIGIKKPTDDCIYILNLPWSEWVGMTITTNTLNLFTPAQIVAICLYNLSYFGYSEEEVKKKTQLHCKKNSKEITLATKDIV